MLKAVLRFTLALPVALLASGFAFTPYATAATSPIAYIYVQTTQGVEVFSASSTGALTKVSGSPFADSGQMGAINGSYLVSVGTDNLHTYAIESNGAVGKQASEIDTQSYSGSKCGTNSGGALFDHTGKYLYVLLTGSSSDVCSSLQSYKIASNGSLTYLGDSVDDSYNYHGEDLPVDVSTISGSDTFGYGIIGDVYTDEFSQFTRESSGALLQNTSFTHTDPSPNPSGTDDQYFPLAVAADPANHLAVVVNEPFTNSPPPQLASYTINANGDITSTNTWKNMPTPAIYPALINMAPSGKQLAVAGAGIEIYNFNGASPLTLAASLPESSRDFGYLAWDKNNHLYAVDYETGNLYVYTVGANTITAAPGSPYTISDNTRSTNQYDLIVVPK